MKDKWALYEHRGKFIAEMRKDDYCVPSIRVEYGEDGAMQSAHFSGWKVEIAKLGVDRCDTLNSVLDKLGKLELCCGIGRRDGSTLVHPVLSWGGDKINIKNIYRSTSCSTIVDVSIGCPMCSSCMSEQFKNDEEEHHPSQVMLQVDDTVHDMIKATFASESSILNTWQQMFFGQQLANSNAHPSSRRYHPDVIRWAMELYCRSPSAYDHLRTSQVLTLPSPSTLNRYRNVIPPQSGINKLALKEMERVIKDKGSLIGFVALDEMKVRENLVCRNGKLIGFVDKEMARNGNNDQLASHILVFYVRTVKRDLSIPLAWYATRNSPASKLCRVFWELLIECESRSVKILAVIADGHSTNRRFFQLLSGNLELPCDGVLFAPNICDSDRNIYLCSDPSHLIKIIKEMVFFSFVQTVRNSLYASKVGGKKHMRRGGQDIVWRHIKDLYMQESVQVLGRTRLSPSHVELTPYSKMKVNLATDVLSWNVGQCLKTMNGTNGTAKFEK
ncbi:uncharacterized protein LOC144427243 [Styela clava]